MTCRTDPAVAFLPEAGSGFASLDLAAASAARGNRAALARVLEAIGPMVVGHCRATLVVELGTAGADAVAEDVCTALLTGLPHRRDVDRPFLSYVYEVTVEKVERAQSKGGNVTLRSERRATRAEVDGGAYCSAVAQPRSLEGDASHRMRKLLADLPAGEREVLILRLVGGLNAEETAAALGSTPGVVRLDQHRAMTHLREAVAKRGSETC